MNLGTSKRSWHDDDTKGYKLGKSLMESIKAWTLTD